MGGASGACSASTVAASTIATSAPATSARCCAQDGTFEKLVKPVPAEAASDQLVNLQLDRDTDSVMDEEEDEGEEDEPVAEEEPEQGEGEEPGADEEEGEAAEHSEGAVPQKDTDARPTG